MTGACPHCEPSLPWGEAPQGHICTCQCHRRSRRGRTRRQKAEPTPLAAAPARIAELEALLVEEQQARAGWAKRAIDAEAAVERSR